MHRVFIVVAAVLALACAPPQRPSEASAQSPGGAPGGAAIAPGAMSTAEAQRAAAAAMEGLQSLRGASNAQTLQVMGLDNVEQASQTTLGAPLPIWFVGLDQLRAYTPDVDPTSLLNDSATAMFPVIVGERAVSSVTVQRSESGEYRAVIFGEAATMGAINATRFRLQENDAPGGPAPSGQFLVRVPALNLDFLGARTDGRLTLTPTSDRQDLGLAAGSSLPAEEVFARLAPLAKAHNGLPS